MSDIQKTSAAAPAYKRRRGDRKDGRLLRSIEPIAIFSLYIMNTRNDANNSVSDSVDLAAINKYVHKKRQEGFEGFNAMYVLAAAYVRVVSQKPGINRFINGHRIYARNNIEVSMMVKKAIALNAPETMFKFFFKPEYTINEVYEDMHKIIYAYQNEPDTDVNDDLDKFLNSVIRFPRFLLRFVMRLLYWLDYHGMIPQSLLELSPFHGSMVLSSMGSLGVPSVFHHLYNFGNVPMFITFSTNRHENEVKADGSIEKKHFLDYNITMDDRICDGHYYSAALHDFRKYLKNPELLERPPEVVVEDIP